jgi:hypothetical protein
MKDRGSKLIASLLANPKKFDDSGNAYELLQEYFAGYPISSLRELLRSEISLVQKSAIFVAAELGRAAKELLDDIVPFLAAEGRFFRYHALEIIAACATGEDAQKFQHVILALEGDDQILRGLAMRLAARVDQSAISAVFQLAGGGVPALQIHSSGLSLLMSDAPTAERIRKFIRSETPLMRRYGAIAARRTCSSHPEFMADVATSDDAELGKFYQDTQEECSPMAD